MTNTISELSKLNTDFMETKSSWRSELPLNQRSKYFLPHPLFAAIQRDYQNVFG